MNRIFYFIAGIVCDLAIFIFKLEKKQDTKWNPVKSRHGLF